jgi:hypothetical protein
MSNIEQWNAAVLALEKTLLPSLNEHAAAIRNKYKNKISCGLIHSQGGVGKNPYALFECTGLTTSLPEPKRVMVCARFETDGRIIRVPDMPKLWSAPVQDASALIREAIDALLSNYHKQAEKE